MIAITQYDHHNSQLELGPPETQFPRDLSRNFIKFNSSVPCVFNWKSGKPGHQTWLVIFLQWQGVFEHVTAKITEMFLYWKETRNVQTQWPNNTCHQVVNDSSQFSCTHKNSCGKEFVFPRLKNLTVKICSFDYDTITRILTRHRRPLLLVAWSRIY